MPRFRRRVTDVVAVQWTGSNLEQLRAFAEPALSVQTDPFGGRWLSLRTPSGPAAVEVGDWIAQNPTDPLDFYPIKPEPFGKLYESEPIE